MIQKLIHTPDGKLTTDDPWSVPGTRIKRRGEGRTVKGTITEDCIKRTNELNARGTYIEKRQYVAWDGGHVLHSSRRALEIIQE